MIGQASNLDLSELTPSVAVAVADNGGFGKLKHDLIAVVGSSDTVDDAMNALRASLPYDAAINSELAMWSKNYIEAEILKRNSKQKILHEDEFENKQFDIDTEITFEWVVTDEMLEEWQEAEQGKEYYSQTFGIDGNWCMIMKPYGNEWDDEGNVILGLRLLRMTQGIKNMVSCKYRLRMKVDDEEIVFEEPADMEYDAGWVWPDRTLSNDKLKNFSKVQIFVNV